MPLISELSEYMPNILATIQANPVTNVISPAETGNLLQLIQQSGYRILTVVLSKLTKTDENQILVEDFKNQLYSGPVIDYDIVALDEAEAQTLNQSLILLLWHYYSIQKDQNSQKDTKVPRLLLLSVFPVETDLFPVAYFKINPVTYPTEIRYSTQNVYDLLKNLSETVQGDILVFTSDSSETDIMRRSLASMDIPTSDPENSPSSESSENSGSSERIIITDNCSTCSNNVVVIVDLMQNVQKTLTLTGGVRYIKRYVTKQQADIRISPKTKTQPLLVYRMVSQEFYQRLRDQEEPEIFRTPLYYVMLELMDHQLNPFNILFSFNGLQQNYDLMLRLKVIENNQITNIGRFALNLPLGLRIAVALYHSPRTYEYVALLAMIDSYSKPYYVYPLREDDVSHADYTLEMLEHYKTHYLPLEGKSDVHTYAHIWNSLMTDIQGPNETELYEWCQDHALRYENMSEALSIFEDLSQMLQTEIIYQPFDVDNIMNILAPILLEIYNDRKLLFDATNQIRVRYIDNTGRYYKIDYQSVNSIEKYVPSSITGIITSTISSDYTPDFHTVVIGI